MPSVYRYVATQPDIDAFGNERLVCAFFFTSRRPYRAEGYICPVYIPFALPYLLNRADMEFIVLA